MGRVGVRGCVGSFDPLGSGVGNAETRPSSSAFASATPEFSRFLAAFSAAPCFAFRLAARSCRTQFSLPFPPRGLPASSASFPAPFLSRSLSCRSCSSRSNTVCFIACASADVIARSNAVTSPYWRRRLHLCINSTAHLFASASIPGLSVPLLSASTANPLISTASIRLARDRSGWHHTIKPPHSSVNDVSNPNSAFNFSNTFGYPSRSSKSQPSSTSTWSDVNWQNAESLRNLFIIFGCMIV